MSDEKINFLYNSIADTQATIRAIDVKLGFLFVVIMAPLTQSKDIFEVAFRFYHTYDFWPPVIIFLTLASWFFSGYFLLLALIGISNPREYVDGIDISGYKPKGIFYGGYLFDIGLINIFFTSSKVKSLKNMQDEFNLLPNNESEIVFELVLDKMKVSYIREVKIIRLKYCIIAVFLWIFCGFFCLFWGNLASV